MEKLKWKEPWLEPPTLWKDYICFDTNGRMIVRSFVPVRIVSRKRNGNIKAMVVGRKEEADTFAFVSDFYLTYREVSVANKVAYYMELPEVPDPSSDLKKLDLALEEIMRRKDNLEKFKMIEEGELKWLHRPEEELEV